MSVITCYSIVIPMYNEYSRGINTNRSLEKRLHAVRKQFKSDNYEVIIVDDASTDNTKQFCEDYVKSNGLKNWKVLSYPENKGKGFAILYGIKNSTKDAIVMLDADLSVTPRTVKEILYVYNIDRFECIIGNRFDESSVVCNKRTLSRRIISLVSHKLIKHIGDVSVNDSQCGFKVFRRNDFDKISGYLKGYRWLFDVELLYALQCLNVRIVSVPVVWDNMEAESTLCLKNALRNSLHDFNDFLHRKQHIRAQIEKMSGFQA